MSAATAEADLRRHIDYLATDALAGRKPGTAGETAAAHYIAGQLASVGVQPGAPGGGWYQPVPLVERSTLAVTMKWQGKTGPVPLAADAVVLTGRDGRVALSDTRVIFAGHGVNLGQVDLKGAIVLLVPGTPARVSDAPPLDSRRQSLFAKGAAAVLVVARANDPWELVRGQLGSGKSVLASERVGLVEGAISHAGWQQLAAGAGSDAAALARAASEASFTPLALNLRASLAVETRIRAYSGFNVVGLLPGRDPASGRVVHMAHYDHLGVCRPEGAPDRVCNGAVDNASGVAMLIEIARGLAGAGPAARDQLFLATTAEEMGLLGARAYVEALGEDKASVVAALNYDTVAIAPKGEAISIIGRGSTPSLDAAVDRAARSVGRNVDPSDAGNAFIARQDGWEFLKRGVPAVMAGGSFTDPARLAGFFAGPYHQPHDDLGREIELGGAAEDTDFGIALGRLVADPSRYQPR